MGKTYCGGFYMRNKFLFLAFGLIILGVIAFVLADSYQDELSLLEQDLIDSGYSWLINYSGEDLYPSVGVYEKIPAEILIKKMRIDEIKKGINLEGGSV
jgi:hypothetical protein